MRNAKRETQKVNWIIGIEARLAARMCAQSSKGHRMIRVRPVNVILGALLSSLYSN